jgi:hypothetical protein
MERFNTYPGKPFILCKGGESASVVSVQAVLRPYPKEAGPILEDHLDRQILKPFLLAVELEVVSLCVKVGDLHQGE